MFFGLIGKYWRNILDAIIIVAIILAVFLINPFGMFGGGLKLQDTANNITAIKQIGQLITAEYYGEVISTIDQSRLRLIYEDDLNLEADILFQQMKMNLLKVYVDAIPEKEVVEEKKFLFIKWKRKVKEKALNEKELFKEYINIDDEVQFKDSLKIKVLEYYWRLTTNTSRKLKKEFKSKHQKTALWLLMQEIIENTQNLSPEDADTYLKEGLPQTIDNDVFSDFFYDKKRAGYSRKEEKKELSIIGRGWVKAGFDFGTLDESNFIFDKDQGVVHLFGVSPEILDADINPWFIPEKKIPGIQIIEANGKVDFNDAVLVKSYCVEKLRKMADDAGILDHAEKQGKEAIKSFIGLISGVEVQEVFFHYDPFAAFYKNLSRDKFISYNEAVQFDSLVAIEFKIIDSLRKRQVNLIQHAKTIEIKIERLNAIISKLKECEFAHTNTTFNKLSALGYRISADSILTPQEFKEIKSAKMELAKWKRLPDSLMEKFMIWYNDSLEFVNEYNFTINSIRKKTKHYGERIDTILFFTENTDFIVDTNIVNKKKYDTTILITYVKKNADFNHSSVKSVRYTVKIADNWELMTQDKNVIRKKRKSDKVDSLILLVKVKDTLVLGEKFVCQFPTDSLKTAGQLIFKTPQATNLKWAIYDSIHLTHDENLYLNFLLDRYWQYQNRGFFSRASDKVKETFDRKSFREKTSEVRKSAYNIRKSFSRN